MSRIEISYYDYIPFQQATKGLTRKLISIMRGRDVDVQFIEDMLAWMDKLTYLVNITDIELKSSLVNDVSVVRCVFAKLDVFGSFGEFSNHLFNIVMFIRDNEVKKCRSELRYLINMVKLY
jgi:hypothetical protein